MASHLKDFHGRHIGSVYLDQRAVSLLCELIDLSFELSDVTAPIDWLRDMLSIMYVWEAGFKRRVLQRRTLGRSPSWENSAFRRSVRLRVYSHWEP